MPADAVGLIEAAYDVGTSSAEWLRGVGACADRLAGARFGVSATLWSATAGRVSITDVAVAGDPDFHPEVMRAIVAGSPSFDLSRLFLDAPPVGLASEAIAPGLNHPESNAALAALTERYQARDYVGVNGRADAARGIVVSFALVGDEAFERRHRRLWSRLAVHLGTGLRLLDRLAAAPREPEAVLSPGGKVLHAEGAATQRAHREELAQAARTLDRARGRLRRVDPDEAVALWRALVRGEWSLVDRLDSDGRRFLVAHRNAPGSGDRAEALTAREAHAAALLARGYSNKLIAYELGLAPSTVAGLLAGACRKLGVASNVELIQLLRASA
jgi:DNA-binding CsgD family transcriptional regulator